MSRRQLTDAAKAALRGQQLRGQHGAASARLLERADFGLVDASRAAGLPIQPADAVVRPEEVSQDEHDALVDELLHAPADRALKRFRKKPYERDHWDSVVWWYKETTRPLAAWSPGNRAVLERVQGVVGEQLRMRVEGLPDPLLWLDPHVIDLAENGVINGHVDSVKFSGALVAGLSLLSTRTMRLRKDRLLDGEDRAEEEGPFLDLTLPPRSLYMLFNGARFSCEHSVECPPGSARRLSIIFRDAKVA